MPKTGKITVVVASPQTSASQVGPERHAKHVDVSRRVLPTVPKVVFVQKPFSDPEVKIRQTHLSGIFGKEWSANAVHTEVFAVYPETMKMEVASLRRQAEVNSEDQQRSGRSEPEAVARLAD